MEVTFFQFSVRLQKTMGRQNYMSIKTQASAHALNMPTANSNSLIFFKFFNVSVNWSWNVVILRWIDAAAEILRDGGRGKGDTATLDTLHSQNETQSNSTKAARGGIHWHRVRNHSRGVFSHGMAVWVCFRLSPSTLWSISPGLYNTLKPWGIDTYLNFTQARVLYFCCLNGKCVGWCQMQPSFSALKGIRWRFQTEECSWLPQTAAAWPQSLVWSIRGDVCPKLGWLVSSTATQRKTMPWRRWDFLIQWTDVLICLIMSYEQFIINNWTQTKSCQQRKWHTDLTKRSIRAQQLVEDSEGDTEHGGQC